MTYWKGMLNTQDPRIQIFCEHSLAPRLIEAYDIAKMLYWRDHSLEPLRHPIILGVDKTGINGCHPGQTRFLSSHLLNRSAPIRLTAYGTPDLGILNRARSKPQPPNELAQAPHRNSADRRRMQEMYSKEAELLSKHITVDNAYEFYVDLYKLTV